MALTPSDLRRRKMNLLMAMSYAAFASSKASAWSPTLLFAAGEQGAWYDPSDFSTMFQDAAGTTPVTAVEQPVGLLLDKSKGLALGSELVTNGDFSSGTGWVTGGGWAISGGTLNWSGGFNLSYFTAASNAFVAGKYYSVTMTISGNTSGNVNAYLNAPNNGALNPVNISGNGEKTLLLFAGITCNGFHFVGNSATGAMSIDNVSVRELSGNHASQSTSASRPVLSARVNLLTYTEQFDNAAWTKERVTLSGSELSETATVGVHGVYVTSGLSIGTVEHRLTARVQYSNRQYISIGYYDAGGQAGAGFDLVNGTVTGTGSNGAGWSASGATITQVSVGIYDCSVLVVGAGGTRFPGVFMRNTAYTSGNVTESYTGNTANKLSVLRMDLRVTNDGVGIPAYQRVAAATDYDTSGFPLYLRFDGTDDSLATASIDFSATDKMSVFAGVRKLSDAAGGAVTELSINSNTNTGSFALFAPSSAAANYFWRSYGNGAVGDVTATTYAAPITNVLTGQGAISTDISVLRINGAQVGSSSSDQGTGNFGNYPLYIGRRGGTSLPYNGRLYSLIVRGAQSTDAQIASTETWVNGKTGAY